MKKIVTLFNLLICFELLFTPINLNIFSSTVAEASNCSNGMQWNAVLGRCLTSTDTARVMQATASCDSKDIECYKQNAQSAFDKKVSSGEAPAAAKGPSKFMSNVGNVAYISVAVLAAFGMLKGKKSNTCAKVSYGLLVGGGAVAFVGTMMADNKHKKKLKEIEKDWQKIINTGHEGGSDKDSQKAHATAAQSESFEMLARNEDSIVENANAKKKIYTVAAVAFAGAAVAAGIEAFNVDGGMCADKKATEAKAPEAKPDAGAGAGTDAGANAGAQPPTATSAPTENISPDSSTYTDKPLPNAVTSPVTTPDIQGTDLPPLDPPSSYFKNEDHEIFELINEIRKDQYIVSGVLKDEVAAYLNIISSDHTSLSSPSISNYEMYQENEVFDKKTGTDFINILKVFAKHSLLFAEAHATPTAAAGAMTQLKATASKAGAAITEFMDKPWVRAAAGGVLGAYSLVMVKHMKEQAEASTNRAELLRKMKSEFANSSGIVNMCKPEDRSDTSKPECYCYDSNGNRSSSRTNSQICQKLWNTTIAGPNDYKKRSGGEFTGCINSNNEHDATCACKKSSSGCFKVTTKGLSGVGTGALSLINSSVAPLNDLTNGNFSRATANEDGNVNNAMRSLRAYEQMTNTPKLKNFKKAEEKATAAIVKALNNDAKAMGAGQFPSASNLIAPSSPQEAAALLEKEFDNNKSSGVNSVSNGNTIASPGTNTGNSKDIDFDFSIDEDSQQSLNEQVDQVMDKEFDYAQNDINNSSTNLFEVLTNRYHRSGLRRLFDDEGVMPADPASESDISN